MLDKVGGQELPATENEAISKTKTASASVTRHDSVAPAKKRSMFVSIMLGLLQAGLMVAVLFASFMLAKRMIDEKPEPRQRRAFKTVYTIDTVTANAADYQPVFTAYGQTVAARSMDLRFGTSSKP